MPLGSQPSLISGAVSTVVVSVFLAFTDSFLWACVALAVYGVLYNAQMLAKASMGELCDRSAIAIPHGISLPTLPTLPTCLT